MGYDRFPQHQVEIARGFRRGGVMDYDRFPQPIVAQFVGLHLGRRARYFVFGNGDRFVDLALKPPSDIRRELRSRGFIR